MNFVSKNLTQGRRRLLPALMALAAVMDVGCNPEVDNDLEKRRRNAAVGTAEAGDLEEDDAAPPEETEPIEDVADASAPVVPDAAPPNDCPRARVMVDGDTLNIREMPNTSSAILGTLANDVVVTVKEKTTGEVVSGNAEWFKITSNATEGYVSAAFATCTTDAVTP
jgi:hypothetical protein